MAEVLVVGEALVDVLIGPGDVRIERPGGSPANVAVALHRLGRSVQLLTALGADPHGALLRQHLRGVEVLAAPLPRTGTAIARLDADGRASYAFDLGWDLDGYRPAELPSWLHVGSLAAVLRPGADVVLALTRQAGAAGAVVSFDPNCRPDVAARDLDRVEELVSLSSIVKLSDEDLAWLHPGEEFTDVARRWLQGRPNLVVLTRGRRGATAVSADGSWDVPPAPGSAVVDTVGAGDAFMAGLVDGLLGHQPFHQALQRGALVARRTCERAGADPPSSSEL